MLLDFTRITDMHVVQDRIQCMMAKIKNMHESAFALAWFNKTYQQIRTWKHACFLSAEQGTLISLTAREQLSAHKQRRQYGVHITLINSILCGRGNQILTDRYYAKGKGDTKSLLCFCLFNYVVAVIFLDIRRQCCICLFNFQIFLASWGHTK